MVTLSYACFIIRVTQGTFENQRFPHPTSYLPNQSLWRKGQPKILYFYKAPHESLTMSHFGEPAKLKLKLKEALEILRGIYLHMGRYLLKR